jgi:aminopeptidase N
MFDYTIYLRGGMTLQALREKIGNRKFMTLMRTWATRNRYGNVATPGFVALAESISHKNLDRFFRVWLYKPAKPTSW